MSEANTFRMGTTVIQLLVSGIILSFLVSYFDKIIQIFRVLIENRKILY